MGKRLEEQFDDLLRGRKQLLGEFRKLNRLLKQFEDKYTEKKVEK